MLPRFRDNKPIREIGGRLQFVFIKNYFTVCSHQNKLESMYPHIKADLVPY